MNRLVGALALLAISLSACQTEPTGSTDGNVSPTAPSPKLAEEEIPSELVAANTAFAFDLYPTLLAAKPDENCFISPLSISMAFMMVYNGSESSTEDAMADVFHVSSMTRDEVNYANAVLLSHLSYADEDVVSEIANSIWVRDGFDVKDDFIERNETSYLAEVATRDFDNNATINEINGWVSDRTHEKITNVLAPPIPPLTVMFLINAIYFNGTWTTEFDKDKTTDRPFHGVDGSSATTPTMFRYADMAYLNGDGFQAVRLPYGDGRFAGYVFLPDAASSLEEFHGKLSPANWMEWMSSFGTMEGTLYLPRLEFRYETLLKDPLSDLGMGIAFSNRADYSGISDAPLTLSYAKHMSYVRLDEEGTEAAAVTVIGVEITSVQPPKQTFYLDVNRPFFFAIADTVSNSILFMGSVYSPEG